MRKMAMVALLSATGCLAQEAAPPQSPVAAAKEQAPVAARQSAITVPAGTKIPVKLTYSLWSKTARTGDGVHAVTVFPVTVGTTVAIPAGTYVEGVIDKVTKRASANHPALQMHFTRLLFANGYAVEVEDATSEAQAEEPGAAVLAASAPEESAPNNLLAGNAGGLGNFFAAQDRKSVV